MPFAIKTLICMPTLCILKNLGENTDSKRTGNKNEAAKEVDPLRTPDSEADEQ